MLSLSIVSRNNTAVVRKLPESVRWLVSSAIGDGTSTTITTNNGLKRGTGISMQERMALRASRKERAAKFLESHGGVEGTSTSATTTSGSAQRRILSSRYVWYLGLGVPTAIITWGLVDENSPPALFSKYIGLTSFIHSYTDEIAKPAHEKLLPDWSQVRVYPEQTYKYIYIYIIIIFSCQSVIGLINILNSMNIYFWVCFRNDKTISSYFNFPPSSL
jgi:hypothetical protein